LDGSNNDLSFESMRAAAECVAVYDDIAKFVAIERE